MQRPTSLVVAGPIVRRVEPDAVSIFLLLSKPAEVTLSVFTDAPTTTVARGARHTVRLGPALHAVVVTAAAPARAPLMAGGVYSYDLAFAVDGAATSGSLFSAGVLHGDPKALLYASERYPSFVVPADKVEALRLVHASCRRPDGQSLIDRGTPSGQDALRGLDTLISKTLGDPRARPQLLMLTGDQIYADAVADPLSQTLHAAYGAWVDAAERDADPELAPHRALLAKVGASRQKLQVDTFKLPDGAGANQLLLYGEYTLMYAMVWGGALQPGIDWSADKSLKAFQRDLPFVRRALAHVSTLMIFDDHEVTDDWNLDQGWHDAVHGSPLGRRMVRNALAAYAVMQHWGNVPDRFADPKAPEARLLAALDGWQGASSSALDTMLGVTGGAPAWHYEYRRRDYRLSVLDGRTRRGLRPGKPPDVIRTAELPAMIPKTGAKPRVHFIVSPTPVVGVGTIEGMQRRVVGDRRALFHNDGEAWSLAGNFGAFTGYLFQLGQPIILSGDVHYGFAATLDGPNQTQLVNFVSSATKNVGMAQWQQRLMQLASDTDGLGAGDVETPLSFGLPGEEEPEQAEDAESPAGVSLLEVEAAEVVFADPDDEEVLELPESFGLPVSRGTIVASHNFGEIYLSGGEIVQALYSAHGSGLRRTIHRVALRTWVS